MTQFWTIVDIVSGDVLAPSFATTSEGSHPKDNGWEWDAETQHAYRIGAPPDPVIEAWTGSAWQGDVTVLRARRWNEVKAERDRAEWGGCETPFGRIDTDPDSQRKLSGAVQMAMLARAADQPFALDWTMQDNSTQSHDADAMIAMGVAVGMHVSACHAVATALRAAIGAAATAEEIAAVDVEGGWP